jgi:hypothetical protein
MFPGWEDFVYMYVCAYLLSNFSAHGLAQN